MIIVSTWNFLGFNMDLLKYNNAKVERNVGHAALQVTSGPNRGVYVSWWPGGGYTPDEKNRYASPNSLKEDMESEAENRRNQMSTEFQEFLGAVQQIATSGGSGAEAARSIWEAAMLGDTEEKKRLKVRPADNNFHIPSLADGALYGLDDAGIVAWWIDLNAQLKKAIDKGEYNKSTYYDLVTHNCSDVVIEALIAGGAKEFVPSISTRGIITPDTVTEVAGQIMIAIGEKTAPYSEAVKRIVIDKALNELPKADEVTDLIEKLKQDGIDKKIAEGLGKSVTDFLKIKDKERDARIDALAALIISIGKHLPEAGQKAKNAKHKTEALQELANQALDTVEKLLAERKRASADVVTTKAKKLWK